MIKHHIILFDQTLIQSEAQHEMFLPAKVSFQKPSGTLHIKTDRCGTKHIYYAYDGKRAATGTSFKDVSNAASSKKFDWLGIGGFFRYGFFPDDLTYYEDVKILKPSTEYVFDEHGKRIKSGRYWNWKYEPNYRRTFEQTVDEFARIFHGVIAEEIKDKKIAVPISGGLDSRSAVAAILQTQGRQTQGARRFWSYSYGYSDDSIETRIAAQIAQAANLPFDAYTIKPYLFNKIESIMGAVEGFQDITQTRQAFVIDEIKSRADAVICGHMGDLWMDSSLSQKSKANNEKSKSKNTDELTEIIFNKFKKKGSDGLLAIFKDQLPSDLDEQLKQMIYRRLTDYDQIEDADFKIKIFKINSWVFRWTNASLRMFEAGAKVLLPFYDDRIADFFMTVPAEHVTGRRLQIEYLKKYAPELAKIKWQVFDTDLYHYQNFNTWELPKRIYKKAIRLLLGQKVLQRNWESQFLNADGREGLKYWLVRPHLNIHQFVPAQRLNQEINNFYGNPEENHRGYALSMLLTLSAWLQSQR